jgi:hypothetical protein
VNHDPKLDATVLSHPSVALDEAGLDLDSAADCIDDAAELDDRAIPSALDDAAVVGGDSRVE